LAVLFLGLRVLQQQPLWLTLWVAQSSALARVLCLRLFKAASLSKVL
jgi:hypothetical protein